MIGGGYLDSSSGRLLHPVTAPALVIVGCLMIRPALKVHWKDITEAVPAFLVMIVMPLTFSIASGIAIGFIAYAAIKLFTGNGRKVSWLVYLLALLFIIRFIYLQAKY
jgi:AGZA family xanthine/uracil permease-like MFS transporter